MKGHLIQKEKAQRTRKEQFSQGWFSDVEQI
jgi:hypothetical protein